MSIWCRLGRHEAGPRIASNESRYFGWCGRCEAELMLSPKGWTEVPTGYRIVWRRRSGEKAAAASQFELTLPMPRDGASRPAPPHQRGFGCKSKGIA